MLYNPKDYNHKHVIVYAAIRKPAVDEGEGNAWMLDTVEAINMRLLRKPETVRSDDEGNIGLTGSSLITTSHLCFHDWRTDDVDFIQTDLYSCKDFDVDTYIEVLARHFDAYYCHVMVIDRNCDSKRPLIVTENFSRQIIPIISLLSETDAEIYEEATEAYLPQDYNDEHKRVMIKYNELHEKFSCEVS